MDKRTLIVAFVVVPVTICIGEMVVHEPIKSMLARFSMGNWTLPVIISQMIAPSAYLYALPCALTIIAKRHPLFWSLVPYVMVLAFGAVFFSFPISMSYNTCLLFFELLGAWIPSVAVGMVIRRLRQKSAMISDT